MSADAEMLRRAAQACRNVQDQARPKSVEWFDWVPAHLDKMADSLDASDGPEFRLGWGDHPDDVEVTR